MDEQVKIWQRVRADSSPVMDGLSGLAATAMAQAALYGTLARQVQGPSRTILLKLQEEEQHCSRCLKGIYRMVTGNRMQPAAVPIPSENTEAALRKCYGQTLKTLAAFDKKTYDPEYGAVFGILAAKKREHCCALAELMGF